MCIENGWPRRFASLNEAPAEFAQALLYLLQTNQAHKQGADALERVRAREIELYNRIMKASFGEPR